MKYSLYLFFFSLLLMVVKVDATTGNQLCNHNLDVNINVDDLLSYLKTTDLEDNLIKICTSNYCDDLKSPVVSKAITIFRNNYINYIYQKGLDDQADIANVKGFKITTISVDLCN